MMKKQLIFLFCLYVAPVAIAGDNPAVDAIQEYMEFAEYSDGAISTAQLASVDAAGRLSDVESGAGFQRDANKG